VNNNYNIFPLGDAAASIDLGNTISEALNEKVIAMQQWMHLNPVDGILDCIPAYSSLTLIYDPIVLKRQFPASPSAYEAIKQILRQAYYQSLVLPKEEASIIDIPVCYAHEYGFDLAAMAEQKQLSVPEIIELHTQRIYRVFMIGFVPGFSYMAAVDPLLVTPRKMKPVPVVAGTVGIAGCQTGIYPFNSPGGWNAVGKTPMRMFDSSGSQPALLKAGDRVRFYAIEKEVLENIENSAR
jgi:inhibitor of KinA